MNSCVCSCVVYIPRFRYGHVDIIEYLAHTGASDLWTPLRILAIEQHADAAAFLRQKAVSVFVAVCRCVVATVRMCVCM